MRTRSGSVTTTCAPGRQLVDQQHHVIDQDGRERLHALHRAPVGEGVEDLGQLRMLPGEFARALADLGGEQQLAARRGEHALRRAAQRTLVGDGEGADVLHLVAEELDAQRMLFGRREDVENAAADGEFAAPLDHLDPRVGEVDELAGDVFEVHLVARAQPHRHELAEAGGLRLQDAADWSDDDPQRTSSETRRDARGGAGCASRRPTVSARGESRSCGRVSHDG